MFFYKLKKVLKEKLIEILRSSSILSFIASFIPLFPFIFIHHDDYSTKEKKQMTFVSILCIVVNMFMIYWIDVIFNYNIIISIFLGLTFSFLFFFIMCFFVMLWSEFSEMTLNKDEIRDAKLNSLLRKLF